MSEESEDGAECVTCNEVFSGDGKCVICDEAQCENCRVEGNIIHLAEWLYDCPNKCAKCKRIGCGNCITTCYSCANKGEDCEFLCEDCHNFVKQNCKYHSYWNLCSIHSKDGCPECTANQNYSDRHGMF